MEEFLFSNKESKIEHLQEIINYTPGGMHVCYLSEPIHLEYASDGLCHMLGYTREEYEALTNGDYTATMPADDRKRFAKFVRILARSPQSATLEYRLIKKDGSVITVSDTMESKTNSNGITRGYSSVTDITKLKQAEESLLRQNREYQKLYHDLETSHEHLRLASSAAGIMFFTYDLITQKFVSFENSENVLGCPADQLVGQLNPPMSAHDSTQMTCSLESIIHSDDKIAWRNSDSEYEQNTDFYAEVRLGCAQKGYRWFAIRKHKIFDEHGQAVSEIGCLWNIDKFHQEFMELKQKAETDSMTRLLNKPSAYALIDCVLADCSNQNHALLFFDLDNFKEINDTLGHEAGDSTIHYVADTLRDLFRSKDILARFGGDEFLAFLPNISSPKSIIEKANLFNKRAAEFNALKGTGITLSASIGIAFSEKASSLKELLANADQAVYKAKEQGKCCVAVYTPL